MNPETHNAPPPAQATVHGRPARVAVACGGTGGHIFPGVATADALKAWGCSVTLWLAGKDIETPALNDWTGRRITIPAEGFPSGFSWRAARAAWRFGRATVRAASRMRPDAPDVMLAMGSYACAGPVAAALLRRIPVVLHESNVTPGRAVRVFARHASAVAGCFEETRHYVKGSRFVLTGMPLRADLRGAAETAPPRGRPAPFTLLVMGGSRGARRINDIVSETLTLWRGQRPDAPIRVIHLTGEADEAAIRERYAQAGLAAEVMAFARDMGSMYARADFAICRAGAATCAELRLFGIPSLLIPYPFAAGDHQTANARAMTRIGAAHMAREDDLSVEWLLDYLQGRMSNPEALAEMRAKAASLPAEDPAEALARLVLSRIAPI